MAARVTALLQMACALISISGLAPAQAGFWTKELEQPVFTTVPTRVSTQGRGRMTELQQLANGETFVNKLLGTDCFTRSLSIVNKDCSKLDSEKKSRLAMALAICHLDQLGLPTFSCKPSMSLKQCAGNMGSDRQYTTYMEFLSNIDTMCLFLQSQDFQRHTEFMINSLYSSSQHAAEQLNAVDSHLAQSLSTMDNMVGTLSNVETTAQQQLQLSHQNLEGVQQLQQDSQQVHAQLSHALQNEELMLLKQSQVLTNLASLDEAEAARAESASLRWQGAQQQAQHLFEQQHQYQQVQQQLLGDLRQLSDNSAGLRSALDIVVQYEQRGAAMLTHMLGSTYSVQDLLTSALAALGIAATGLSRGLKAARLPLIVLFALSVMAERAMLHSFHHLLEIDPVGEVMMAVPAFGTTVNPKTIIRRLCLATAVAIITWTIWKHTDSELEILRACERIEHQQQLQYELQQSRKSDLLRAQRQQYINFMAEWRHMMSDLNPTRPDPIHDKPTIIQQSPPLLWMEGADGDRQQLPEQLETQQEMTQTVHEDSPGTISHDGHSNFDRTQQPQEDELRKEDELFRQQPHDEQSHTPSRNGPAKECMQDSTQRRSGAQQKKKKKSSASQAAEFTLSPQEHATKIQAMLEATSQVKCKAGKRQRADSKEQSKQMSEAQDQPSTVKPAEQEGKRLRI